MRNIRSLCLEWVGPRSIRLLETVLVLVLWRSLREGSEATVVNRVLQLTTSNSGYVRGGAGCLFSEGILQ